jgi:hypothetical protein
MCTPKSLVGHDLHPRQFVLQLFPLQPITKQLSALMAIRQAIGRTLSNASGHYLHSWQFTRQLSALQAIQLAIMCTPGNSPSNCPH